MSMGSATRTRRLTLLALLALVQPHASGDLCRHWLAAQHDFGAYRGFYLNLENASEEGKPCVLDRLQLILGVADGRRWRFIAAHPRWSYDHDYQVRAAIDRQSAELWLDGVSVGRANGGFIPDAGPLTMNCVPNWANGRAEYLVRQADARITVAGGATIDRRFPALPPDRAPLALFAGAPGVVSPLKLPRGASLTIEARFRIEKYPSLRGLSPFIDRYGQGVYAAWPGKIRSDADLRAAAVQERKRLEQLAPVSGFDRYGGYKRAGWKEKPTGFFRAIRRGGRWWLVTPDGNPCFYTGVCGVPMLAWEMTPVTGREFLFEWLPPKTGPFAAAWARNQWGGSDGTEYVAFHTANMIRKYGPEWAEISRKLGRQRLRAFAFSGVGKWDALPGFPYTPVLGRDGVPNLVRHPDVFDPAVVSALRASFSRQIGARRSDPMVVGWSVGNEFDEIVTKSEVAAILAKSPDTPARREMLNHVRETTYQGDSDRMAKAWGAAAPAGLQGASVKPPDADIESMRRFYEDAYYACLYRTIKQADPNHLYLGNWIVPGWWENEEDWRIHARHCDVVGYDRYAPTFSDAQFDRLMREAGKPVFCGEFSFPPTYRGTRGFGVYPTSSDDDANAGALYARWIADAARSSHCVGGAWFMYRDQPLTGRGPGRGDELIYGEHYAFGIVDVADRPKWDLVTRMRSANAAAVRLRLGATR